MIQQITASHVMILHAAVWGKRLAFRAHYAAAKKNKRKKKEETHIFFFPFFFFFKNKCRFLPLADYSWWRLCCYRDFYLGKSKKKWHPTLKKYAKNQNKFDLFGVFYFWLSGLNVVFFDWSLVESPETTFLLLRNLKSKCLVYVCKHFITMGVLRVGTFPITR